MTVARRLLAEALGSALLLAIVVGSGIMGERLSGGNGAIALLANSLATGAGLVVLILWFAPLSGAHFNPAVSLAMALEKKLSWRDCLAYSAAQTIGALAGVALAHLMFDLPLYAAGVKVRSGIGQFTSEVVAAFGLIGIILACLRTRPAAIPYAVGLYILAAYWFTASTSFANPAVTVARAASDTFANIRAEDVLPFIAAQILGALLAWLAHRGLWGKVAL